MSESRPPFPPFTEETARQKVLAAEAAWNTRDPARVAAAYTVDSGFEDPRQRRWQRLKALAR